MALARQKDLDEIANHAQLDQLPRLAPLMHRRGRIGRAARPSRREQSTRARSASPCPGREMRPARGACGRPGRHQPGAAQTANRGPCRRRHRVGRAGRQRSPGASWRRQPPCRPELSWEGLPSAHCFTNLQELAVTNELYVRRRAQNRQLAGRHGFRLWHAGCATRRLVDWLARCLAGSLPHMLCAHVIRGKQAQKRRALAAASTAGRPLASSRSTMQTTAATIIPASRAASMALMVDAPVVQTSSTMTTRAPSRQKPSMRRPVPWAFSALRTRKPCSSGAPGFDCARQALAVATLETMGSAPSVSPPTASASMPFCFQQFKDGVSGEAAAFGVKGRGAAVNVVVAGAARGELELAEAEARAGEEREQLLRMGCLCHLPHSTRRLRRRGRGTRE